nr:hypothetical protein [Schaalia hyovaginalis]
MLELLALDQRESVLRHKRDTHPAFDTVRELAGRAEDLQRAAVTQSAVISDIAREAARIEKEIEAVSARCERQSERLKKNQVPLRDISALEHEIDQVKARRSKLEDDLIATEVKREAAVSAREAMLAEARAIKEDVEATKAAFNEDVKELDAELREVIKKRRDLAASLPAELLDAYECSRALNGAFAVLELRNGIAVGMATELAPAELQRIRLAPEDEVCWTEETRAIVVRTRRES